MARRKGPITMPGDHQDCAEGVSSRETQPGAQISILEAIEDAEQEVG
jgi:hypothetical protein